MGLNRTLLWLLGAGAAGALLLACSHTSESTHEPGVAAPSESPSAAAKVLPVLDVPALLGLTVDELPARLGPAGRVPATFVDPAAVALNQIQAQLDSSAFFRYKGVEIVVNYDAKTRHLNDVTLLGSEEDQLMQQGQLTLDAPKYLLVPVFKLHQPTVLLGLRAIPVDLPHLE